MTATNPLPTRHQRRRTRGWTTPLDAQGRKAKYVGSNTRFGNPWFICRSWGEMRELDGTWWCLSNGDVQIPIATEHRSGWTGCPDCYDFEDCPVLDAELRAAAVDGYRRHLAENPGLVAVARAELAGRDLMCWCAEPAPGEPDHCHAALLIRVVAGEDPARPANPKEN